MELRNAVISASAVWKRDVGDDTNLVDVMFQAVRVARAAGEAVPAELPERLVGVRLVEIVDRELIKGDLIRTVPVKNSIRPAVTEFERRGMLAARVGLESSFLRPGHVCKRPLSFAAPLQELAPLRGLRWRAAG
jgi:hypothetical protein